MSATLSTAHPRPVREAIERRRAATDPDAVEHLGANGDRLTEESRAAAVRRLGVPATNAALVDSATLASAWPTARSGSAKGRRCSAPTTTTP